MTENSDVVLARIDQRLIVVEREIRDIKASANEAAKQERQARPSWPAVVSSLVATAALLITLIQIVR